MRTNSLKREDFVLFMQMKSEYNVETLTNKLPGRQKGMSQHNKLKNGVTRACIVTEVKYI